MPSYKTAFGSFLKIDDLQGREVKVTIDHVQVEEIKGDRGTEKKLVAHFVGKDKALVLNRVNSEAIAQIAGTDDYDNWIGVNVVLYGDPSVMYGGKRVGGLRIKGPGRLAPKAPEPPQEYHATDELGDDPPF
jgi:hypothetical protein